MLKITRSPNMPTFRRNNNNNMIIKFGVDDGDSNKAFQYYKQLDYLICQSLERKMVMIKLLNLILIKILMNH